jgi:hypothetical protein
MSAPGKLVRSSRWKSGPSKGQRPLGSECCVTTGDSGGEAYTARAWGVGLSPEMMKSRERRLSSRPNATCAMPLCEALSSRRGRRPHHAHKDRVGTWDIPRLTSDENELVRIGKARSRSR